MADMASLPDLPQVDSQPSTIAVRRSSRLQVKQPLAERQLCSADNQVPPERQNQNHIDTGNHTASISEEEAARLQVAADVLLRLMHSKDGRDMYGLLPDPFVSIGSTPPPGNATKQSDETRGEKENIAAPLSKTTTGATQVSTTITTVPSRDQQTKTATTIKRARSRVLKRKVAAVEPPAQTSGSVPDTQNTEPRPVKRIRTKFVAEPSDRTTRSSKAKEDVEEEEEVIGLLASQLEGAGAHTIDAAKDGLTEPTTSATNAENAIVNSNVELPDTSTDPAGDSNQDSVKPPRLTSANAASAATECVSTDIDSGEQPATVTATTTTSNNTPAVEAAITAMEEKVELKALDSVDKEPSASAEAKICVKSLDAEA